MAICEPNMMTLYANTPPLITRLRSEDWRVRPVTAYIVIGHMSTALLDNHAAFTTLGIAGKKAQQAVQNKLVDISIDYTARIVRTTTKARAAHANRRTNLATP